MGKKAKIGDNIRHVRKAFHETQKDLAAALHVNESTVSGWESGRNEPDFQTIHAIADHYRLAAEQLLTTDMSSIPTIIFPSSKDMIEEYSRSILPLIYSEAALEDEEFKAGYDMIRSAPKDILSRSDEADRFMQECSEHFVKSLDENETEESACNLLFLLFSHWLTLVPEEVTEAYKRLPNNGMTGFMKGIMLNKMPINDDYTLSVKSVFLEMCDDFITALLRVAKRSERTSDLADYYLALRYIAGMVKNDYSLGINRMIGGHMMAEFANMGNEYAEEFMERDKSLFFGDE